MTGKYQPVKVYDSGSIAVAAGLFVLTVLTRLPLADTMLFNLDSVHFALAMDEFDVALHQPHPPGYFLYVMLGRLVRVATGDPNTALVCISITFSALTVSFLYVMGSSVYGSREGLAAALIALTSPIFWFHGIVGLSYAAEGFLSLLMAYLCYRMLAGDNRLIWPSAVVLGLAGGLRQTTLVFLVPLWLYSIRKQGLKRMVGAGLLLTASFLLWFLPMLASTGGYGRYQSASEALFHRAVWRGMSLPYIADNARLQFLCVVWGLLAALLPLCLYIVRNRKHAPIFNGRAPATFFGLWLGPALAFYLLVMSKEVNPGYSLVYMVGLYLLAGKALTIEAGSLSAKLSDRRLSPVAAGALLLAGIMSVSTLAFLFLDYRYSLRGLSDNHRLISTYLDGLRRNFPPDRTVVIGGEYMDVSYRHVAYYLPEYLVYYIPAVHSPTGSYYLRCKGRRTEMAAEVVMPEGVEYIVHFVPLDGPLPEKAMVYGARALNLDGVHSLIYYDCRRLKDNGVPVERVLLGYRTSGPDKQ